MFLSTLLFFFFHLLHLLYILLPHILMYILTNKSTFAFLLDSLEATHFISTIFSTLSKEGLKRYCLYACVTSCLSVCFFFSFVEIQLTHNYPFFFHALFHEMWRNYPCLLVRNSVRYMCKVNMYLRIGLDTL